MAIPKELIHIVIPTYNRVGFCVKCIESIFDQTYDKFELIIVDDGSIDKTHNVIKSKFPDVTVLHGTGDLWWTGATNKGCEYALNNGAQLILTLNDDLILRKDYLEQMMQCYSKHQNAMIGSLSVTLEDPPRLQYAGTVSHNYWTGKTRQRIPYLSPYSFQLRGAKKTLTLPGRGTLIPRKIFEEIGLFNFKSYPQYSADYDFSLRAKKVGFELLVNTEAIIYSRHESTGTGCVGLKEDFPTFFKSFFKSKSVNYLPKTLKFTYAHHPVKAYVPVHVLLVTLRTFVSYFRARARRVTSL